MINLIFDTETTGLVKHPDSKDEVQPRIIEWAGALAEFDGTIIDEVVFLINPGVMITEEITNITGITNEMLASAPPLGEVIDPILTFMARAQQIIAHNLPFDWSLMELEARRLKFDLPVYKHMLCTVAEHEPLYGFRPRLTTLYEDYMGKPLEQTHRALDDVHALVEVCHAAGVLL